MHTYEPLPRIENVRWHHSKFPASSVRLISQPPQADHEDPAGAIHKLDRLEQSLCAMEKRLQARMDANMEKIMARLDGRPHAAQNHAGGGPADGGQGEGAVAGGELEQRMRAMDDRLAAIAEAVRAEAKVSAGDDDEDRKRLKERLKEALATQRRPSRTGAAAEGEPWMEYLFGICRPDGRVGKKGSRSRPRRMAAKRRRRGALGVSPLPPPVSNSCASPSK